MGRQVVSENTDAQQYELNVRNWPSGAYILIAGGAAQTILVQH
jgi:hypothetical protein